MNVHVWFYNMNNKCANKLLKGQYSIISLLTIFSQNCLLSAQITQKLKNSKYQDFLMIWIYHKKTYYFRGWLINNKTCIAFINLINIMCFFFLVILSFVSPFFQNLKDNISHDFSRVRFYQQNGRKKLGDR